MENNLQHDENILKLLNDSFIQSINIDPVKLNIKIDFYQDTGDKNISLELQNTCLIKISSTLNYNDGCYLVGIINLQLLTDGGEKILSKLGYSFTKQNGEIFSYSPEIPLYYLSLEGDICLDIISGNYKIYEK